MVLAAMALDFVLFSPGLEWQRLYPFSLSETGMEKDFCGDQERRSALYIILRKWGKYIDFFTSQPGRWLPAGQANLESTHHGINKLDEMVSSRFSPKAVVQV